MYLFFFRFWFLDLHRKVRPEPRVIGVAAKLHVLQTHGRQEPSCLSWECPVHSWSSLVGTDVLLTQVNPLVRSDSSMVSTLQVGFGDVSRNCCKVIG